MTIAATKTNLNDVQDTKISIIPMDKSDNEENKVHRSGYKEFRGLIVISLGIIGINACVMLYYLLLAMIQLVRWEETFADNWNSDIQTQYNQMRSSVSPHIHIFTMTLYSVLISIIGIRNLIKIWRRIRWMQILVPPVIFTCFFTAFVIFVCPSKPAQVYAEAIFKDEYALSNTPSSLLYLKSFCTFGFVQNIFLIFMICLMKPKNFDITFYDNQYLPLPASESKDVNKEESQISQEKDKKEEEIDKICENYVIC